MYCCSPNYNYRHFQSAIDIFRVVEEQNPAAHGEAIDWSIGLLPAWHTDDISVMSSSLCKYNVFTVGRLNAMVKYSVEIVFMYFKHCLKSAQL